MFNVAIDAFLAGLSFGIGIMTIITALFALKEDMEDEELL